MPLLRKELIEQANRRRTYVVRAAYATLLFLFFCLFVGERFMRASSNQLRILGRGRDMFDVLLTIQFFGICLFLPAMMCGVITAEKERRSFGLLLVTDLRPGEILLEKYWGRIVPMLTCLMLSLPPLAVCYAFGGMSADYLAGAVYILVLTCLQVGAVAIMCSAWCRTTAGAFISAFLIEAALFFGIPFTFGLLDWMDIGHWDAEGEMFFLFPPYVFYEHIRGGLATMAVASIGIWVSTLACLGMARLFVVRRAFAWPRHRLRRAFATLDRARHRVGRLLLGGPGRTGPTDRLPDDRPVAWRESRKGTLGRRSHLLYVLILVEAPVLLISVLIALAEGPDSMIEELSVLLMIVWPIAVLVVTVLSAGLFARERSGQTLDILLTTPISSREIVRQKMRGIWRLVLVVAAPLLTIVVVEILGERGDSFDSRAACVVGAVLSIVVYLPLAAWMSLWISLKLRMRRRAIPAAIVAQVALCALPLIAIAIFAGLFNFYNIDDEPWSYVFLLSPVTAVVMSEFDVWEDAFESAPLLAVVVNYGWYGGMALLLRRLCLRRADRYFGRIPDTDPPETADGRATGGE